MDFLLSGEKEKLAISNLPHFTDNSLSSFSVSTTPITVSPCVAVGRASPALKTVEKVTSGILEWYSGRSTKVRSTYSGEAA